MHVVIELAHMTAAQMQDRVERVYRRFYSIPRIAAAALRGTFGRFRRLTSAQREQLAHVPMPKRIASWVWLHALYKYAPAAFLATGRRRIRAFRRDFEYHTYIEGLREL
jgi:hypothetical protein